MQLVVAVLDLIMYCLAKNYNFHMDKQMYSKRNAEREYQSEHLISYFNVFGIQ